MNKEEEKKILNDAIAKFGINHQLNLATEEFAEIIQAINKCRRKKIVLSSHILSKSLLDIEDALVYDNLLSEIADVEIMNEQLKLMFDPFNKAIPLIKERKLERLKRTING